MPENLTGERRAGRKPYVSKEDELAFLLDMQNPKLSLDELKEKWGYSTRQGLYKRRKALLGRRARRPDSGEAA